MNRFDWGRINPRFWFQNNPTSDEWDAILNRAMDTYKAELGGYETTLKLGPLTVWTANWPYAYGSCWSPSFDGLPRVATRKRLRALAESVRPDPLGKVKRAIGEQK